MPAPTARLEKLDRVFCNVGRHWPGLCMGHLVSLDFSTNSENIERVTAPNDHQNEPTLPRQPKCFYFMCGKIANMASYQLPESEK